MLYKLAGTFIIGLLFGSFFNALIWRFHRKERITGRHSRCVHCGHDLGAWDLVPLLSYLWLRGRCRFCHKPIPWHYPVVEFAAGLLLLPVVIIYGLTFVGVGMGVFVLLFLLLFLFDLRYSILPDAVTLPSIAVGFVLGIILGRSFESIVIGGILGAGFFLFQYAISRGTWIGGGDIRLGAAMGFALGWQLLLLALVLSYVIGSVVAVGLLLAKRKTWKSQIPFGTFLTATTYLVLLCGEPLLQAYLRLLL